MCPQKTKITTEAIADTTASHNSMQEGLTDASLCAVQRSKNWREFPPLKVNLEIIFFSWLFSRVKICSWRSRSKQNAANDVQCEQRSSANNASNAKHNTKARHEPGQRTSPQTIEHTKFKHASTSTQSQCMHVEANKNAIKQAYAREGATTART